MVEYLLVLLLPSSFLHCFLSFCENTLDMIEVAGDALGSIDSFDFQLLFHSRPFFSLLVYRLAIVWVIEGDKNDYTNGSASLFHICSCHCVDLLHQAFNPLLLRSMGSNHFADSLSNGIIFAYVGKCIFKYKIGHRQRSYTFHNDEITLPTHPHHHQHHPRGIPPHKYYSDSPNDVIIGSKPPTDTPDERVSRDILVRRYSQYKAV
mmetsp:Transcript_12823/g.21872  ORF Transcript_12823/g.21872 Transcript_12823/m.21872 type:complete len:206 (+) Transcript_12823:486-1103(+)